MTYRPQSREQCQELCHPLPLAAIGVLLLNDHVLKGSGLLPGLITGKLSDLAGLFFFPILLFVLARAIWQLAWEREFPQRTAAWCAGLGTIACFTALKLWPAFNTFVEPFWGAAVMDATDLFCLPSCLFAVAFIERFRTRGTSKHASRLAQFAVVLVAAGATMATQPSPRRNFPNWELQAPSMREIGVLEFEAWSAKSGKTGLGLLIEARNDTVRGHTFQVVDARLELFREDPDRVLQRVDGRRMLAPTRVLPKSTARGYVAFAFDNEGAWNEGLRHAHLVLEISVDGAEAQRWRMPAAHVLDTRFVPYRESKQRENWRGGGSDAE